MALALDKLHPKDKIISKKHLQLLGYERSIRSEHIRWKMMLSRIESKDISILKSIFTFILESI